MAKSQISLRSGVEGPKHDPYGYQELIVTQGDMRYICHIGLAVYIRINDLKIPCNAVVRNGVYTETYEEMFKRLTGDTAENWIEKYMEEHKDDVEDPMGCLADYE